MCPGADSDETNKAFRAAFDEYKKTLDVSIGGHPIEVYAQTNLYQDLMSVGCYSVTKREWLVGPDVKDTAFDPMSEYYAVDMKHIDSIISDIRNVILECYEMALVIKRSTDADFKQKISGKLDKPLAKAKKLFNGVREKRRVMSAPESAEEALKMRNSRTWHIADSAFKLMDKFGYMPILKAYSNAEGNPDQKADAIISVVKDNLANNKMLTDSERELFMIDEGVKEGLSMAAIAAMLAIPGILPAKNVETQLKQLPRAELKMNSDPVQKLVKTGETINGLFKTNVINVVARTIYAEAKSEGAEGQSAVASVIWNRAGGDNKKFVDVIKRPSHFSCWNKYTGGWTDDDGYKYKVPDGAWLNRETWNNCVKLATDMVNGDFKSTIGNRNCYMNKAISDKKNVESWGKLCDYKVGHQHFGYQKCYDGFKNVKTVDKHKTYTVVKGDTLEKIAKSNGTTSDNIAKLNGLKDKNKIRIGQKLKI